MTTGSGAPAAGTARRPGYRESVEALRQAQKPPRGVSLYSTWVNRPLGRRLAALAHVADLTPNQVTVLSAVSSLAGVAVLVLGDPSVVTGLLVSALLVLGFALDSADGQLARLRRAGSASGEFLDHVLDCALKSALHAGVLVALYQAGERGALLLVPLGFQLVSVLLFFGGVLVSKLHQQAADGAQRPPRRAGSASSVLLLPVDHGVVSLSFLLWGSLGVFQGVYLLLFLAHAAVATVFTVAWFRELS